jgi:hypothetical protein
VPAIERIAQTGVSSNATVDQVLRPALSLAHPEHQTYSTSPALTTPHAQMRAQQKPNSHHMLVCHKHQTSPNTCLTCMD